MLEGLERQCRQGVEFGFDGKTLIHPDQIVVANRAFAPEPDEVAWARTIAAAFDSPENRGKGVLRVEGPDGAESDVQRPEDNPSLDDIVLDDSYYAGTAQKPCEHAFACRAARVCEAVRPSRHTPAPGDPTSAHL